MTGREYLNQIRDTDLNIRCKEREIFKIRQEMNCKIKLNK